MSNHKQLLKDYLAGIDLKKDRVLSIGKEHDDRKYFKSIEVKEWVTMDREPLFNPDILHDLNDPIWNEDYEPIIDERFFDYFDAVLAFELGEYLYDPMVAHKNIFLMLKPEGIFMGSYPFFYPHHNPLEQDFLRYTDMGIQKILIECGFKLIKIKERPAAPEGAGYLKKFIDAEGMRLAKERMPYSCPTGYIVEAVK